MLTLHHELIVEICEFLSDRGKIRLSIVSKKMDKIKYTLIYHEKKHVQEIVHLPYFDNFRSVEISDTTNIFPKYAKYVYFKSCHFGIPITKYDPIQMIKNIPPSVTHLEFNASFNEPIDKIPQSITHLSFGPNFNQSIKGCILSSVIHLKFGSHFRQSMKDSIPTSVTHLELGYGYTQNDDSFSTTSMVTHLKLCSFTEDVNPWIPLSVKYLEITFFDRSIETCIPPFVTHLTLHDCHRKMPDYIQASVTHLVFGYEFNKPINNLIPPSVTHLTFGGSFNQPINDCIPLSVIEIKISKHYVETIDDDIISRVKIIRI